MAKDYSQIPQWYIVTVIGGKEKGIINSLKEKLDIFNLTSQVKDIKIFETIKTITEYIPKNDPSLPKTIKNTEKTQWEVVGDKYKKSVSFTTNKFPGYVFISAIMSEQLWFAIRNSPGVLGFVGSKTEPIPISITEYEKTAGTYVESKPEISAVTSSAETFNFHVGMKVKIAYGGFKGEAGVIKKINLQNKTASIEVNSFGRKQLQVIDFHDIEFIEE